MLSWKKQKRVMLVLSIASIPVAVMMVAVLMSNVGAKKGSFTDDSLSVEEITTEEAETPKTPQISPYTGGGMPCENPEQFKRWHETYEQETSEEAEDTVSERETVREIPSSEAETDSEPTIFYEIDGEQLNPDIQTYLYDSLSAHGIEWFMPYAVLICYQESRFNPYAENPNGKDKGLFQYRKAYYTGQDIFNPYEQIDIFTQQMAHRAEIGCDVYEMISRHNVSDYGSYNHTYVAQVMQHEQKLREVKQ